MSSAAGIAPHEPAIAPWRRHLASFLLGGRGALAIPILLAILLALLPWLSGGSHYWLNQVSNILLLALVVSGLNLSFGYAGEVQFSQVFMFALGAYLAGILAIEGTTEILILLPLAGAAALAAGVVVAVPALRIGGWSLAMASFYLVITTPDLVEIFESKTGGLNGLIGIPAPTLLGVELTGDGLYLTIVAVAVVWLACYRNLVTSRYGVTFRILRESPIQASSLGVSPARTKLLAYAIGALPAGMAGCMFGFLNEFIQPTTFGLMLAIGVVAASVLGGNESVYGAVVGAAILQLGPQSSLSFAEFAPVAYGVFLILAAIMLRRGLGGVGKTLAVRASRLLLRAGPGTLAVAPGSLSAGAVGDSDSEEEAHEAEAEVLAHGEGLLPPCDGGVLEVRGVSKAFGGVQALRDVTLTAQPGAVTALIGSNGSGKTALLNVICGFTRADAGEVQFKGRRLSGLAPHRVARAGVGRTFQTPSVPRGVSVLDVVASGRFHIDRCGPMASILRLPRYWSTRRDDRARALIALDLVGLAALADEEANNLSLGFRRLVEVARALCGEPSVLLLDEPASGLSEDEVERLGKVIRAAADSGVTVVLIEHNFAFVAGVADVAHVLHIGQLIASGPVEEIARNPDVIESYLGSTVDDAGALPTATGSEAP